MQHRREKLPPVAARRVRFAAQPSKRPDGRGEPRPTGRARQHRFAVQGGCEYLTHDISSPDEWREIIATNLDGTFVCMRQARGTRSGSASRTVDPAMLAKSPL